jgi:hypothetical protein
MKFNENISKNNWPEKKGETKTEKMSKWLLKINRDPYIENPLLGTCSRIFKEDGRQKYLYGFTTAKSERGNSRPWWKFGLYPYDTYFELVDQTKSEEKEYCITISQLSIMPENVCVSWDYMIKAIKYFYDHDGKLNLELKWREFEM